MFSALHKKQKQLILCLEPLLGSIFSLNQSIYNGKTARLIARLIQFQVTIQILY